MVIASAVNFNWTLQWNPLCLLSILMQIDIWVFDFTTGAFSFTGSMPCACTIEVILRLNFDGLSQLSFMCTNYKYCIFLEYEVEMK